MDSSVYVSVIVPARDEADNLSSLIPEIVQALDGEAFEIVVIDDGSQDGTAKTVRNLMENFNCVRLVKIHVTAGKSGAIWIGAAAARGVFAITLDGDGQNDPKFLKPMLDLLRADERVGLVAGQRYRRSEGRIRLMASRIANVVRGRLLGDNTWDSACGLKAFRMTAFRNLPYFETLHRFLPALMDADGWRIVHLDVVDRPRAYGQSKYGIWDRLVVGIPDLFGVWWLLRRRRRQAHITSHEENVSD